MPAARPRTVDGEDREFAPLRLCRGEDARLRAGHLWVFANEVDVQATPLTAFAPGDPCTIIDDRGRSLGVGYVNPHSLIAARLLARAPVRAPVPSLLVHRLKVALSLRERLFAEPYYRLLYGEADGVPGLTLDRFGDVVVAQATTAGIERLKPAVEAAVRKVVDPRAMVWKNDAGVRALEQLPSYADMAFGELAPPVMVREAGLEFAIDPVGGQKTGWFYDQRPNRDRLGPFVRDARVLDLFAYAGAWGLRVAAEGAREVLCVDASASAVAAVGENARRNGLDARVSAERADVFEFLHAARERRERYDVVIVDPPAFVKRRKDLKEGALAYRRVNELAMQVLARDGILVTCSCSYHLPEAVLRDGVQKAARHLDRHVQVLARLGQGPDHPVHPAIPETEYLKGLLCRVLPS